MLIDQQTFRDLEIFEGRHGRGSLFTALDRARTRGGAAALRRRFQLPNADYKSIRAVQDSVRYVIEHPDIFADVPSEFVLSGFHHYFHWLITAPVAGNGLGRISEMIQLRIDNSREYQQISTGVSHTVHILRALQRITTHAQDAPGSLSGLLEQTHALLARPAFQGIPATDLDTWPFWRMLNVDRSIRGERQVLLNLVQLLFEIDAIAAMARATEENGFVLPEVVDGVPQMHATGVYHPFLASPISNPLDLDQQKRMIFLTGPNMAGKTTYLRSCGIALYLAHIGMGVPARTFRFAPCDAFFTAISLSDDIREGVSFFQAEAIRARTIAEALAAGQRVVAIMDEPFKGTNVKDALEASCAFFSRLAARKDSLFLIASHLIEAAEELEQTGNVECRHFEATENGGDLEFDYVLRSGVSEQRLGMTVLKEHRVFELLDQTSS